jgi:hypothetical protein
VSYALSLRLALTTRLGQVRLVMFSWYRKTPANLTYYLPLDQRKSRLSVRNTKYFSNKRYKVSKVSIDVGGIANDVQFSGSAQSELSVNYAVHIKYIKVDGQRAFVLPGLLVFLVIIGLLAGIVRRGLAYLWARLMALFIALGLGKLLENLAITNKARVRGGTALHRQLVSGHNPAVFAHHAGRRQALSPETRCPAARPLSRNTPLSAQAPSRADHMAGFHLDPRLTVA